MDAVRQSSTNDLEVDVDEMERVLAAGGVVIDVREPDEFASGHVLGTRPVPLGSVPQVAAELPRDRPVLVVCRSGRRSLDAAHYLVQQGIDAKSVAGGVVAWQGSGRPLQR
ncbi:MAG TPA: rhodanese-like domain-containing protein [Mycobacteriales bacterium]|nr:rhodanese-like domain-containing protein [Mycobacteriales bacterium]